MNLSHRHLRLVVRSATAAAFVFSALEAAAQVTLAALARDGYGVVPISQPKPNMLVSRATINGAKLDLVLDTGFAGEGISLDSGHARKIGLAATSSEKEEGFTATGKKLSVEKRGTGSVTLGNAQIQGVPLFFGTFRGLRNAGSFQTGTHIDMDAFLAADGFLSSGFMRACSAVIDLHNRMLYLRPPGTGRRAALGSALTAVGLASVPFTFSGGNCIAEVEINGAPTSLFLDTGATLTSIDTRFADRIKTSAIVSHMESRDAAGVTSSLRQASVSSFKIAGVSVRAPDVQISNLGCYSSSGGKVTGFLGMDILGQNWSIIDFGEQKLYIAKAQ
jgi:predicted aspartyl protease